MTISFEVIATGLFAVTSFLFGVVIHFLKEAKTNLDNRFVSLGSRVGFLEASFESKFSNIETNLNSKTQFIIDKLISINPEKDSIKNNVTLIETKLRTIFDRLDAVEAKVNEIIVNKNKTDIDYKKDIKILHHALMVFKNDLTKLSIQKPDS
jgi:oligoendopeptidase F